MQREPSDHFGRHDSVPVASRYVIPYLTKPYIPTTDNTCPNMSQIAAPNYTRYVDSVPEDDHDFRTAIPE